MDKFRPDFRPVVGSKVFAGYGSFSGSLDSGAAMHWNLPMPFGPAKYIGGVAADLCSETGNGSAPLRCDVFGKLHDNNFSLELMSVNSKPLIDEISGALNTPLMKTVEDVRREKLAVLIAEAGSQVALSEKIDKVPAQISQWLNASINSKTGKPRSMSHAIAREIEKSTGKPRGWMDQPIDTNTQTGPDLHGKVPLITWEQAHQWCRSLDQSACRVAEVAPAYHSNASTQAECLPEVKRWLDCPVPHSEMTFVLCVRGDSMTAPHGRSYPDGCLIFVDREKRSPSNGQRVLACLDGTDHVTFKVYKNEDGRQWLQPLNPSHEPIRQPFHILGTVIGKWEDE